MHSITKNRVEQLLSLFLVLTAFAAVASAQNVWYVGPGGSPTAPGTAANPWDLETALTNPNGLIQPGDTVLVRGGIYYAPAYNSNGEYWSIKTAGWGPDPSLRITISGYPGERATINGWVIAAPGDNPSYLWLENLEFQFSGSLSMHLDGIDFNSGTGTKLINCVIHDNFGDGIGGWQGASQTEIYGCSIFHNGYPPDPNVPGDRWHGHCIYSQNAYISGQKLISNNILHCEGDGQFCVHLYTQGGNVDNFLVTQNIARGPSGFIVGACPSGSRAIQMVSNYIYNTPNVWFGGPWNTPPGTNTEGVLNNNLVVNPTNGIIVYNFAPSAYTATGNQVVYPAGTSGPVSTYANLVTEPDPNSSGTWTYQAMIPRPTGSRVIVMPNAYDSTRANLQVFNWDLVSTLTVDLSSFLTNGESFKLMDPENLFGTPVLSGTYNTATGLSLSTHDANGTPVESLTYVIMTPLPPPSGTNLAPSVWAGLDQSIHGNTVALKGVATDDGLPIGSHMTSTWTKVSGPGTVTFANAAAAQTTATFSTTGTYDLRLSATDSLLSAQSDANVIVMPATSTPILQLSFEEGSGAVAHDSSPNGHDANLVGVTWVTPGKIGTYAVQFSGSSSYARIPNFALGASSYTVAFWFMQTLPAINSGEGLFSWGQNIYSGGPDINVWTYSVPSAPLLNADLEDSLYGTGSTIGDENYITYPVDGNSTAIDPNGGKNPAAGDPNLIVGWHHYCLVASGAAAAGINKGATVYIDGVQKSADPNIGGNPITPATDIFLGGRYSLAANRFFNGAMDEVRLYDHALAASEVADLAGVSIANAAPTANAGPNKKIMLCTAPLINSVALAGTISDDGQPNPPATCTAAWSKLSGPPAAVTFANAAAASTTATFTSAGTYVLQLTASDSVLIGTSNVTVIILAPGDFNGDGRVDGVDFLNWQSHYPTSSGATCDHGDANGDGKVDGVDFLVWQSHYHG